jgi:O-antigen ligase
VTAAAPATAPRGRLATLAAVGLVVAVGLSTLAAGVLSGGDVVITLAPVVTATLVYVLLRAPLRWSTTALVFLLLSLEVTGDAEGFWSTPLIHLGDLLSDISGSLTGVKMAGFEVVAILLLMVAARRRMAGSTLDGSPGQVPSAIRDTMAIYLAGFAYASLLSLATGRGLPLWKVRYLLHVPFLFLLFHSAYRRTADLRPVAVAVVAAAQVKALLAAYVQLVAAPELTGGPLAYATNHGDSVLFAVAILIVVAAAAEEANGRALLRMALLIPLPLWAMALNRRRIAWGMIEASLLVMFLLSRWRPWKKRLVAVLVAGAPLLVVYLAAGWNSDGTGIFGPVHKVRTMLDSSVDSSTYWREIESWNIASSLRQAPLVGLGLGGEYTEFMQNADISIGYPDYRRWPHNTVLGQLLFLGVPGFAATWMLNLITLYLAARAYRRAATPYARGAALVSVGAIVSCCFMAWGDTGVHFVQHKLAAALSLTAAAKLALETGAWPNPARRLRPGRPTRPDAQRSGAVSRPHRAAGTSG